MSEVDHGCSVNNCCVVEWIGLTEGYMIVGVPSPQYISICVFLYNLVEEDCSAIDLPEVIFQSEISIVYGIVSNIMMTEDAWKVRGSAQQIIPEVGSSNRRCLVLCRISWFPLKKKCAQSNVINCPVTQIATLTEKFHRTIGGHATNNYQKVG